MFNTRTRLLFFACLKDATGAALEKCGFGSQLQPTIKSALALKDWKNMLCNYFNFYKQTISTFCLTDLDLMNTKINRLTFKES